MVAETATIAFGGDRLRGGRIRNARWGGREEFQMPDTPAGSARPLRSGRTPSRREHEVAERMSPIGAPDTGCTATAWY